MISKTPPCSALHAAFSYFLPTRSRSEQQRLSKAGRDLATTGAGWLVNTFSNTPETDWEVGADKQLYSEEKEAKSQAVWPALYHWADPRQPQRVYLLKSATALPLLTLLWGPVTGFFSAGFTLVLCISMTRWWESLLASKWCHRETLRRSCFFWTFPFHRPISIILEYSTPLSRQTYYRNAFPSNNRKGWGLFSPRETHKMQLRFGETSIALWFVWRLTVNSPNYCSKTGWVIKRLPQVWTPAAPTGCIVHTVTAVTNNYFLFSILHLSVKCQKIEFNARYNFLEPFEELQPSAIFNFFCFKNYYSENKIVSFSVN